jgi:hypothetical protein
MVAHYSDHETEGDRELIQAAQLETFAELIPQQVLLPENNKSLKTVAA